MAPLTKYLSFFSSFSMIPALAAQSSDCTNPMVRREWRTLSKSDRADWISAVNCLTTFPHDESLSPTQDPNVTQIPPVNTSSTFFDDITYLHMDLNPKIHFTGLFLPWHRAYVHNLEISLRDKCGYQGAHPYWNWSMGTEDVLNSGAFDSSPTSGLGRSGDPDDDYVIKDGGFKDLIGAYPVPHHIRRNFSVQAWPDFAALFKQPTNPPVDLGKLSNSTFAIGQIEKLVDGYVGDFQGFQAFFESLQGPHTGVHAIVGGDMLGTCPRNSGPDCIPGMKWAPTDHIFFLHHAMVDKVWYDWQLRRPENFWSFHGGSVAAMDNLELFDQYPNGQTPYLNFSSAIPFDGLYEEPLIYDVMNTTSGKLCYVYE